MTYSLAGVVGVVWAAITKLAYGILIVNSYITRTSIALDKHSSPGGGTRSNITESAEKYAEISSEIVS
jgi:hypothetical protein